MQTPLPTNGPASRYLVHTEAHIEARSAKCLLTPKQQGCSQHRRSIDPAIRIPIYHTKLAEPRRTPATLKAPLPRRSRDHNNNPVYRGNNPEYPRHKNPQQYPDNIKEELLPSAPRSTITTWDTSATPKRTHYP